MKKGHTENQQALGEVVSSSITGWIAESWQNEGSDGLPEIIPPGFGTFLKARTSDGTDIIAVVYNVITGPQDNNHRPAPLRLSREQLKLEQPHIFALLRTEIHALTIGYAREQRTFQHLPPQPPQVHDFVYPASEQEIRAITEDMEFLRLVSTVSAVPADELLAASIRTAYKSRGREYAFLIQAGQALSHLYREDYDRLISVLRKLKPETI